MPSTHFLNPQIDHYLAEGCGRCPKGGTPLCTVHTWRPILAHLRALALAAGLTETLKWGVPCYTYGTENVLILHGFKAYCAINFFKGALLTDPEGVLTAQTDRIQATRQIRFTTLEMAIGMTPILEKYLMEAIEIAQSGAKVALKTTAEMPCPDEWTQALAQDAALQKAFQALTPGRQRAYLLHFSAAKQSKTRWARIEKCTPAILSGKGLND